MNVGGAGVSPVRATGAVTSVKRGFGWSLAGYIAYMACQWAMLVVLTRLGSHDGGDVALFTMALATSTPVILFFNLGLRRVFATDAKGAFRFVDYFTLRMASNFAALAAIAGFIWLRGYRAELVWATLALGAAKMIEGVSDVLHGFFQERRRIDVSAKSTIFRGTLSLAGFILAFTLTRDVFWAIIAMGAGWAVVLVCYEWPRAARFLRESSRENSPLAPPSDGRGWLKLAYIALPLGIVALVTSLKASIPIFVIESHLGETALACFAAAVYFFHGVNRVVSSLGEAAAARLASLHAARDSAGVTRLLARMLGVSLAISLVGLIGAYLLGGPLLRIFYGPMYGGLGWLLVGIMAAALLANLQTVLDYALMALRQFRIQPYLYGGGAGLLAVLCLLFIPQKGLPGAALAMGLGAAAELLASGAIVGYVLFGQRSPRAVAVPEAR